MSDRDVLKRASEALRDTTEASPAELAALRARVLSGKLKPLAPPRRRKPLRWLLPLAAAFVAGSALAATPGALQGMLDTVERFLRIELLSPAREASRPARKQSNASGRLAAKGDGKSAEVQAPSEPSRAVQPEPAGAAPEASPSHRETSPLADDGHPMRRPADQELAPPLGHDPSAGAAQAVPSRRAAERPRRSRGAPAETAQREPTPSEAAQSGEPGPKLAPEPSQDLVLYKQAHALHFRGRYAQALAAWDTYLRRVPDGTLALEANYNRALCLIRLGRYAEARAALTPFAAGKLGQGYRREEAARFLEAMEKVP